MAALMVTRRRCEREGDGEVSSRSAARNDAAACAIRWAQSMTDALTKAADAAIAAGGDTVHLANLAARRTRSPLAPANAPPPTSLSRTPSGERVTERRHSPRLSITLTKLKGGLHAAVEECPTSPTCRSAATRSSARPTRARACTTPSRNSQHDRACFRVLSAHLITCLFDYHSFSPGPAWLSTLSS